MGLVQRLVGWVLALVLLVMFPWLAPFAVAYWAWRRGVIKRGMRRASGFLRGMRLARRVAVLDASVSTGLKRVEAVIRYEAPCEESHYIVVEMRGERRLVIASRLQERAGTPGHYGRVVAAVMGLVGGLGWSATFAFSLSGGEVGGLIALDRPAPASGSDTRTLGKEVVGQIEALERAIVSVAPSLTVRSLRGGELASLALWGGPG